jgi:hypothetical protein
VEVTMTNDPDVLKHQIKELEDSLALVLPKSARSALVRELTNLYDRLAQTENARPHVTQSVNRGQPTYGTAITSDNYGQNIGVNYGIAIIGRPLEVTEQRRLGWYLQNLANNLERLRLQGIASRLAREGEGIALPNVYVMLATTGRVEMVRGTLPLLENYTRRERRNTRRNKRTVRA